MPATIGLSSRTKCASGEGNKESRVDATRFDVDDIIDQLLQKTIDPEQLKERPEESNYDSKF